MKRMWSPVRQRAVQMPEVFAYHTILVHRVAISAQLLQLVEQVAPVDCIQLRQELRQHPYRLQARVQGAHRGQAI